MSNWKIRLQQKITKEGDIVDVKVKSVYRPTFDDQPNDSDEPTGFQPVCKQMLLEYTDKLGNTTVHKVKYFAGKKKEIINHVGKAQTVHTGGFIYEYQPAVQLDYNKSGRRVISEKQVQQKESRMPMKQFAQWLEGKHGKALSDEIMGEFGE